jgi:hypothetical protein
MCINILGEHTVSIFKVEGKPEKKLERQLALTRGSDV